MPLKEKGYRADYLKGSRHLGQNLIAGANRYLEMIYEQYIMNTILQNKQDARQGGHASFIYKVQSFLRVRSAEFPLTSGVEAWNGLPFWPQVFFCFRCGYIKQAIDIAEEGMRNGLSVSATFIICLQQHHQSKKLSKSKWKALHEEYNKFSFSSGREESVDIFKAALYVVIGRFRDNFHLTQYVAQTTEDYMWLKLNWIWESEESMPDWLWCGNESEAHKYNLSYLQQTLRDYGEAHFNSGGSTPLSYFKVLLLSQQFEQAIAYLVRTDYFSVGVHFALVLDYYGLLRRNDSPKADLLSGDQRGLDCFAVNFLWILKGYVESFVHTNTEEAFHYYYLLRSFADASTIGSEPTDEDSGLASWLCPEQVTKLIMQTKEFDSLVGTLRPSHRNHQVIKSGCVYRYFNESEAQSIIIHAGELLEQDGNFIDGIKLFTLAERDDIVVTILIKQLGRLLTGDRESQERYDLFELASSFLRMRRVRGTSRSHSPIHSMSQSPYARVTWDGTDKSGYVSDDQLRTLELLVRLVSYFNLFHEGPRKYDEALKMLQQLSPRLVPSKDDNVQDKVTQFEQLDESVRRNMPAIALSCMRIYHHKYVTLKQEITRPYSAFGGGHDSTRNEVLTPSTKRISMSSSRTGMHTATNRI